MKRFSYPSLLQFAYTCLEHAGADSDVAQACATYLLEGDLLGFDTHGIKRLYYNLAQLRDKHSRGHGEPEIIRDRAAVATWDAHFLPGPYIAAKAVEEACYKARHAGTATIVVRRCQHVASLAAYLRIATDQGFVISLMASTPAQRSVAPHGGKAAVFSPNPFAIGVPTREQPMLLDISFSMTAAGKIKQAYERGQQLPWPAIIKADGKLSSDPADYVEQKDAAILPLGGADLGYKGYGLCLMSEIWTMALANYGRVQGRSDGESNTLCVQILDPAAFGESETFYDVTEELLDRARRCPPIDPQNPVRIPGQRSLERREQQLASGVELDDSILTLLAQCAEEFNVQLPGPL
ncbi:lactate dehydrogenase [Aliidiomarina minuta]|uniref:Lactate dehydrogenase n=1 Tax=Aliidiomarina minuta TaxID=880057 RepID=A0A432W505_9GAMM|nr:Ldh family oxidoreductase [Aliidiomarina minuta]RUO24549.1 lactate dehydrogenase [Aliidiomarina minuta]